MIGKVQQDSFQSLRIRIDAGNDIEFDPIRSGFSSPVGSVGDSLLLGRDCQEPGARMRQLSGYQTSNSSSQNNTTSLNSPNNSQQQQQQTQSSSRYKTEMCRPFQENGVCKYGEKCQFAHGHQELRTISRHPKYKTDMCRTYHSVGFCPYGPRCHFIHSLDELRPMPTTPEKKSPGVVKQLPMFGGGFGSGGNNNSSSQSSNNTSWSFPDNFSSDMKNAVHQLNNYFNVSNNGNNSNGNSNISGNPSGVTAASRTAGFNSAGSSDSSRSGSFCSDIDSLSSTSPPPYSPDKASRLPIFSRLA